MAEPRARHRARGQLQFNASDLQALLHGFGDDTPSLPLTISCLDEILTDFILETCHAAALSASYSRRQKIKVDDFKFVLRKDGVLLGRVLEQMWKDRGMKEERKVMDFDSAGKEGMGALEGIAEMGGVREGIKKKGKRGRKRKAVEEEEGGESSKRAGKRQMSEE